ncbi:MAG: selenide, water dikinase SelD [Flavobacteriales bacterium]
MAEEAYKLTQYSKSSGCGCKLSSADLNQIIGERANLNEFPNLLTANSGNEDAAIIKLNESQCLITTLDFFAPIVDDAFNYGRIASSNAISDIYAMGGKPIVATAILGWPIGKIPHHLAHQVMEGARKACSEAKIPLAGGHSIESSEPFFGLSVNGLISENQIKNNNSIQEGDLLFITKPIGTGILSTALKRGLIAEGDMAEATESMCALNKIGAALGVHSEVHALTDITGFGLLGHLTEMIGENELSIALDIKSIPVFKGVEPIAAQMVYPDMTTKNYSHYFSAIGNLDMYAMQVLCDPQTSGGLIVSVTPSFVNEFLEICEAHDVSLSCHKPIGKIISMQNRKIVLEV